MSIESDSLVRHLWPDGSGPACAKAYLVLDGARDEQIAPMVRASGLPFCCLYAGELSPALAAAAPYLVQLAPESRFFKELVPKAWGRAWGIFAVASADSSFEAIRKHCRSLLKIQDERGRSLLFRYYDPRVLSIYWPTCEPWEKSQFLGPWQRVAFEHEHGHSLRQVSIDRSIDAACSPLAAAVATSA